MLRAYVTDIFAKTEVDLILLLSKAPLIGLYQGCGFHFVRVSPVCHGKETWFELRTGGCHLPHSERVLRLTAWRAGNAGDGLLTRRFCH
jgi:hypothetical protein